MGAKKGEKKEKKGGKKEKSENTEEAKDGELEHIDRAFFELQIATLEKKLAKLRQDNQNLTTNYTQAKKAYDDLQTDRADVVAFLKLSIQKCSDENRELQDRLKAFQIERQEEVCAYENKIIEINDEFKNKIDHLKSEITLLAGQLNALEEFRTQKEKLEENFKILDKKLEESELRYKVDLELADRKVILVRHEYKKEVDRHLMELQKQFQDTLDLRITAATKNLVQEHFATVKEYNDMVEESRKLQTENEQLRAKERNSRLKRELSETEAKQAIEKTVLQANVIKNITQKCKELTKTVSDYEKLQEDNGLLKSELTVLKVEYEKLATTTEENAIMMMQINQENETLEALLKTHTVETKLLREKLNSSAKVIKKVIEFDESSKDSTERFVLHDELFYTLLELLNYTESQITAKPEPNSFKTIYKKGDLGFVPSDEKIKRKVSIKLNSSVANVNVSDQLIRKASANAGKSSVCKAEIFETIKERQEYANQRSRRLSHVSAEISTNMMSDKKIEMKPTAGQKLRIDPSRRVKDDIPDVQSRAKISSKSTATNKSLSPTISDRSQHSSDGDEPN